MERQVTTCLQLEHLSNHLVEWLVEVGSLGSEQPVRAALFDELNERLKAQTQRPIDQRDGTGRMLVLEVLPVVCVDVCQPRITNLCYITFGKLVDLPDTCPYKNAL